MGAPSYFVYEGDGVSVTPRRPTVDDVGGAACEDDQDYPPDPNMPDANSWNQIGKLAACLPQVCPVAVISVTFSGGAPIVSYFAAPNLNLTSGDITPTDNGTGDTTLEWAADTFPPRNLNPAGMTLNESTAVERVSVVPGTNSVRVRTLNGAGAGVDCAFSFCLYGQ
jgi:hypothetical protein